MGSECIQIIHRHVCMYVDKICELYEEGEGYDSMKEKKQKCDFLRGFRGEVDVRCFMCGEQAPKGSSWPVHEAQAAHVPESGG